MPIDIKVAPPSIVMSQGRTFMVTDQRGEIAPASDEGVFAMDTRFVSYYRLFINRESWIPVNSSQLSFYAARMHLTNPKLRTEEGDLAAHTLRLTLERSVGEGIHEDFTVINYANKKVAFVLELAIRSDFADISEVRAKQIVKRGRMQTEWEKQERRLRTSYDHDDFHRAVVYSILSSDVSVGYANGRIFFEINLEPGQQWQSCSELILECGEHVKKPTYTPCVRRQTGSSATEAHSSTAEEQGSDFDERQKRWLARCPSILTPNEHVFRMYRQAVVDMGALRIYDLDVSDEAWVPAAGVPWFVTLFGRDSLIVSLQTMMVSAGFAYGALKRLAEHQASERDDWRDAQPGKILHEMRFGELAHFHTTPFTPYYGTADATILYLLVLSETYRWTGNVSLLKDYRTVAESCLHWIDTYGDLDGDGFQEYQTFSSLGYENMGWKDAEDAVVYADGSQVKQPKALCELQGYVYDAKLRMAEVFQVLGDESRAHALRQEAEALKRTFNQTFWMEEAGYFAYGLDPQKKQITSIASNAGHCLWNGIADQEKAERTARRLLQEDMWSGWGIRTLSSKNPAYNPFSYQNGSIWPHDNGMIAAGFKRYGLADEANSVIRGVFDAARRFEAYRLPEVFAGLQREGKTIDFPALYPGGANIPQAWASGSMFQMVQTMLGIRADAPQKRLYVNPTLPSWLTEIEVRHLCVGPCSMSLHFWREGDRSRWEVCDMTADQGVAQEDMIQVIDEPG